MKNLSMLSALLIGMLVLASSCASLTFPVADTPERINWREYNDC
jgi:hypothetical protein